jgi:hypothetical protein
MTKSAKINLEAKVRARPLRVSRARPAARSDRVLVTTSLKIGTDQREELRDLAREAQRTGASERFDVSALVREAIDSFLATRR